MNIGSLGEKLAGEFLEKEGFKLIERNFKTPRWGEIDLVMRDGDTIVLVEVKTRSASSAAIYGGPMGSIHPRKLEALKRAAQFYLTKTGWEGPARIDAVAVVLEDVKEKSQIEHFPSIWVKGLA